MHSENRYAAIDGFRGVIALYVVLHHMYIQRSDGLNALNFLRFGHYAVAAFVAISGFCLTMGVVRRGMVLEGGGWGFIQKRAARLLPPYYAGIAFSLLMIWLFIGTKHGTHWDYSLPITWKIVFLDVVLLQNFTRFISKVNHAFWFMPLIWQLYLLYPLLVSMLRRLRVIRFVIITLLAGIALYLVIRGLIPQKGWSNGIRAAQFHFVALFSLGMAGAYIAALERWKVFFSSSVARWLCTLAVCSMLYSLVSFKDAFVSRLILDIAVGCVTTLVLCVFTSDVRGIFSRLIGTPPLAFLGVISYSLYVVHAPLIEFITRYFIYPMEYGYTASFLLLIGVGTPVIICFAYIFYLLFEKYIWLVQPQKIVEKPASVPA